MPFNPTWIIGKTVKSLNHEKACINDDKIQMDLKSITFTDGSQLTLCPYETYDGLGGVAPQYKKPKKADPKLPTPLENLIVAAMAVAHSETIALRGDTPPSGRFGRLCDLQEALSALRGK